MMYLPTLPLLLATPEFSRMRTDSRALAASTTMRAFRRCSLPVLRSMNTTPSALPSARLVTALTMASVRMSRFPVSRAGGRCTVVDW
jgi:hypothetical protein